MSSEAGELSDYSIGGLYDLESTYALLIAQRVVKGETVTDDMKNRFADVQTQLEARRVSFCE